ncbi:MAG: endonuclease/exonuclease/phosphatase family protein [Caulobacter sp.]|nr:endonuclease/exonuclease/phosphatase family protein [Caulobacter sp.]
MRETSVRTLLRNVATAFLLCGFLLATGASSTVAAASSSDAVAAAPKKLLAVSFNVQFLGHFTNRNDQALAEMLKRYDLVIVQELNAPPVAGRYPDGRRYQADPEAANFFKAMTDRGFLYVLSEEDTSKGARAHPGGTGGEWWVAFYKPNAIAPATDLYTSTGFLAQDRTANPDYDRVPYAFAFRAGSEDMVFISVHFRADPGPANRARRAHELATVASWIASRPGTERDYIVLGDMNFENCTEVKRALPQRMISLNAACLSTTTGPGGKEPYDHVMFDPIFTKAEIPSEFAVIDLVAEMRSSWASTTAPYPGDPYIHNDFRPIYSDHNPVLFTILVDGVDDD